MGMSGLMSGGGKRAAFYVSTHAHPRLYRLRAAAMRGPDCQSAAPSKVAPCPGRRIANPPQDIIHIILPHMTSIENLDWTSLAARP